MWATFPLILGLLRGGADMAQTGKGVQITIGTPVVMQTFHTWLIFDKFCQIHYSLYTIDITTR